jgi:hypothetical protein
MGAPLLVITEAVPWVARDWTFADALDGARALVPEDDREHHREAAEAGVVVGVADADGPDLDEDLVIARVVEVKLLDRQRRACLPGDGGLDLHAVSLTVGSDSRRTPAF